VLCLTLWTIFGAMEPETSHSQPTGEHNPTSIILARLEAMSRDMARMTTDIEKLDSDVVSMKGEVPIMGGRFERVEIQRRRLLPLDIFHQLVLLWPCTKCYIHLLPQPSLQNLRS